MTKIKKCIEFTGLADSDLTNDTIEYFTKSGFRHIDDLTDGPIKFGRGSLASNMWTFNPLKWKSEISIEINEHKVKAIFDIDATGQIPTHKEEKLWDAFIDNYCKYLKDRKFDFLNENNKLLKATKSNSWQYVGWAALGGLIVGIPAGLVAYWTGIRIITTLGAAVGAIVFLKKKINDDKKKVSDNRINSGRNIKSNQKQIQ